MITEIQAMMDPAGAFDGVHPKRLFEAAGLIPGWVAECVVEGVAPKDLAEAMLAQYQYPCPPMEGGTFIDSPVMTYEYPGDPDMQPYMVLIYPASQGQAPTYVACYEHSMFAFKHGLDYPVMYRMD